MVSSLGMHDVLHALAKFQNAESLPRVLETCAPVPCMCAATIKRIEDLNAFTPSTTEPDILRCLLSFSGALGRRRILAHLRNGGIIASDVPFIKLMTPGSTPSIKLIINKFAERHGKTLADITGDSRRPEIVLARFEAAWTCVRTFGFAVTAVSEVLNKNHTTMLSGINKIDIMIQRSPIRLEPLLAIANAADNEAAERYAALLRPQNE